MSAYELSDQKHSVLLKKAQEVADKMSFAWINVRHGYYLLIATLTVYTG